MVEPKNKVNRRFSEDGEFDEAACRSFWGHEYLANGETLDALVECDRVHHEMDVRPPSRERLAKAAHAIIEHCSAASLSDFIAAAVTVAEGPKAALAALDCLRGGAENE